MIFFQIAKIIENNVVIMLLFLDTVIIMGGSWLSTVLNRVTFALKVSSV